MAQSRTTFAEHHGDGDEEEEPLLEGSGTASASASEAAPDDAPYFHDELLSAEDRRRLYKRSLDGSLTFALLLYINIFYFALYAGVEGFLVLFKAFSMGDHPKHPYSPSVLINELVILAFMVTVESVRLVLGSKHELVRFSIELFCKLAFFLLPPTI